MSMSQQTTRALSWPRVVLCLTALLLIANAWCLPHTQAEPVRVLVIHSNDVHGHLYAGRDDLCPGQPRPIFGGGKALARLVLKARAQVKGKGGVLLLDSGDVFHGSPEGDFTKGQAIADFFNLLKYDAAVIGNHEFAYGLKPLASMIKRSQFAWLGANIEAPEGSPLKDLTTAVKTFDCAGVPVAVIGVTSHRCKALNLPSHTGRLRFGNAFEVVPPLAKKLKQQGYVVLLLTHIGSMTDRQLASVLPSVTAILGGHDHIVASDPKTPMSPMVIQGGEYLRRVGMIELRFERQARGLQLRAAKGSVINLQAVQGPARNKAEAELFQYLDEQRFRSYDVAVAELSESYPRLVRGLEPSYLSTLIATAMQAQTGSQAALVGAGGIRGGLPKGTITLRDLYLTYPFHDPLVSMELSGKEFIRCFRHQIRDGRLSVGSSGLGFCYDATESRRKRVTHVYAGDQLVENAGRYSLTVTSFMFERLLRERRIKPLQVTEHKSTVFDALIDHIDVAPDPTAASGSFLSVVQVERPRDLAKVPEPEPISVLNQGPKKLWTSYRINVNQAPLNLLESLPWITKDQAAAIIEHRVEHGAFKSLKELASISGINQHDLRRFERIFKVR